MVSELPNSLARYLSVGIALGAGLTAMLPVHGLAAQAKAELQIRVTGAVFAPVRVFCTSSAGSYGATVTVVCSTGAVVGVAGPDSFRSVNGGAYRYLLQVKNGWQNVGEIDALTDSGTITGWKIIKLENLEYVELTLGW
jgi:hypothetical protein